VVKQENLSTIRAILKEQKAYPPEIIDKIQYRQENDLPYLLVEVESGEYIGYGNFGMLDSSFIKIDSLNTGWPGYFYMPVLFIRHTQNPVVQKLANKRNIKDHEIEPLTLLLGYITENPSYIQRAMEQTSTGCTLETVEKSMQFEIEKLFKMEAPNMAKDYENGEDSITIAEEGVIYEIAVDSQEQFVKYQLSKYLGGLFERYIKRFPDNKELIAELYKKELDEQGRALFGENATEKAVLSVMELFSLKFNPQRATRYEVGEID
jgi:hypothetical protein